MNVRHLIDAVVRQTTVLLAQLATRGGARAPLAHVANQVFHDLATQLHDAGIGRKVQADMFGLALRSYHRKLRRIEASATTPGESLWQGVLRIVGEKKSVSQLDLWAELSQDDSAVIRGIVSDMVESGVLDKEGSGKGRKTSNDDWYNPNDPDAQVTKMKDGRTHLAHKQEHAVDMDSGAIVGVTISGGAVGDTTSIEETVEEAEKNLDEVRENEGEQERSGLAERAEELVADKGYHSKDVLKTLHLAGYRTYISEPDRGRRRWKDDPYGQEVTYGNRRRIRGGRGRALMRKRGELIERSFAHNLETGAMRRTHLRRHDNILKRVLVHLAGFNLALVMRAMFGVGKPRRLQGRGGLVAVLAAALLVLYWLWQALCRLTERHLPVQRSLCGTFVGSSLLADPLPSQAH